MDIPVNCDKCALSKRRKSLVLWRTNYLEDSQSSDADVLFIGEGPGVSEDTLGKPFVGRAGKFLDEILSMTGLDNLRLAWTNVVACRPCDYIGGPNRMPTEEEILNCRERLAATIAHFNPKAVVLLGRVAQKSWEATLEYGNLNWKGLVVTVSHPSAVLRKGGLAAKFCPGYIEEFRNLKDQLCGKDHV